MMKTMNFLVKRLVVPIICLSVVERLMAKPMDLVASERLPSLRAILKQVRAGTSLNEAGVTFLRSCLQSDDPVLVSVASSCVMQMGLDGDSLQPDLAALGPQHDEMAEAFVALAREHRLSRDAQPAVRKARLQALVKSENPYLKIEAAKSIARIDPRDGNAILAELAANASSKAGMEASRALKKSAPSESGLAPLPATDERYELVLSIID